MRGGAVQLFWVSERNVFAPGTQVLPLYVYVRVGQRIRAVQRSITGIGNRTDISINRTDIRTTTTRTDTSYGYQ